MSYPADNACRDAASGAVVRHVDLARDLFGSRLFAVRWHAGENDRGNRRRDILRSGSQKPYQRKDRSAMVN